MSSQKILNELKLAVEDNDVKAIQHTMFGLRELRDANGYLPDKIAFGIIDFLRRDEINASPLARKILNHFEFEAPYISLRAKNQCSGYLLRYGATTLRMFTVYN